MVYGFEPEPITSREAELARQLRERDDQLAHANREIELLRQRIDLLVRKLFGAKSEQLDPAQLLLLLQGMDEDGPGKAPEPVGEEAPRRSTGQSPPRERGPRLPEHLPVIEEVIVSEQVKLAPQDWRRIGEEVSERLDYEPARFLRRRTVRPKYLPRGVLDAVPVVAPLPDSLLERSLVAPGLLAQNENTNGLIRQYLLKGRTMRRVTQSKCDLNAEQLNNRPRKRREYKTPNQCFFRY